MTTNGARTIPFGRPWITDEDREAVAAVLTSPILTHGPQSKAFEEEFAAFAGPEAHALTVSSCMAALHLAYLALGVGPGDEVIVPAQTHTATAHAVEWVGARPVFVDCDAATGNLSPEAIEAAVTPATRAIGLVHFVAGPCDMPSIMRIADRHGLAMVEDCAIALGGRYDGRHVGLWGDVGCFSFYPVKHITTGEGGMLISRRRDVIERLAKLRAFGVDRSHTERTIPGFYDVPTLGLNYRMSEMQAALGRSQLRRLPEMLRRRQANFTAMSRGLAAAPDVRVIAAEDSRATNSHYCLSAIFSGDAAAHRYDIIGALGSRGIGTSIYYPQPVPRMKYYRDKYGYDAARYRNAEAISDFSVALPVGPHLDESDAVLVGESVVQILSGKTYAS